MPEKTIHCRARLPSGKECGKAIRGKDFSERMKKLRRHRKKHHPTAHKQSVKKAQETRERHIKESPAKKAWRTRKKRYGKSGRK